MKREQAKDLVRAALKSLEVKAGPDDQVQLLPADLLLEQAQDAEIELRAEVKLLDNMLSLTAGNAKFSKAQAEKAIQTAKEIKGIVTDIEQFLTAYIKKL